MWHIIVDGEYWKDAFGVWAWPQAKAALLATQLENWGYTVEFEAYEAV